MRPTASRRSAAVTRSRAGRATDRELRRSARIRSAAATVKTKKPATATATVKTKKPATSGILKKRKKQAATAGMLKRKKPASASSEGAGIPEAAGKILEPSELLKLKKKAYKAKDLWLERDVPGALERWKAEEAKAEAQEEEAQAEEAQPKKRKKLVLKRLPDMLITVMKTQPYLIKPIPDQELERLDSMSYGLADTYRMRKFMDDKMYAYEQALVNQYNIVGYAEDVVEVTDDEQE